MPSNRQKISKKVKKELFERQFNGRVCSNYPGGPLSKLLGMHCISYNTFGYEYFGIIPRGMLEIEHLQQYNKGGSNNLDNLHLMCSNCHCLKSKIENMERNIEPLDKYMEQIPLIEPEDFVKMTTNFRDNFKTHIMNYITEKKSDGIIINCENLVRVMNNLVI